MKKWILVCLLVTLTGMVWAEADGETGITGKVKDGYALLNEMTGIFSDMTSGNVMETATRRLNTLIADTRATREAGQIDAVFHHRLRRLLLIFKLVLTPIDSRSGNDVMELVFMREFSDFVLDTTGEIWSWKMKGGESIQLMAAAMEEEFVNLWLYLDTLKQRAELKKKFSRRMLPPPPAPPKKAG